ncbi:MAG: hypothetical protein V4695_01570 [Pseudomonadota bacterium]
MSIGTPQLEALSDKLHELAKRLHSDLTPGDSELNDGNSLVVSAKDCDFLLPTPLTLENLAATVQKKIDNINVLLERARMHESLPPEAQAAAEEENIYMEQDYDNGKRSDKPT